MKHDVAVLVGRFEPFHNAHLALLHEALALAPRVIVVVGSAHQARTPKNPFTWTERAEMIRLAVAVADRARVDILPVRDYYDPERWTRAVTRCVDAAMAAMAPRPGPRVALVGHLKDPTSDYLRAFPQWRWHAVERIGDIDAARVRDALFGGVAEGRADDGAVAEPACAALVDQLPASTLAFVRAWAALPSFARLVEEWHALRRYHDAWRASPWPPVFVTVDALLRCADHVLLIERGRPPGRGLLATPGGFIEQRETLWQSCLRELREETQLALLEESLRESLREVAVFDHPERSQRGRTITHAHYFDLGDRDLPDVQAGDDAGAVRWVAIDDLPGIEDRFHDDHFHMLDHFLGLTRDD